MVSHSRAGVFGKCVMVSHCAGLGVYGPRHGMAWCGRAGALLQCLDLGMVPRGPLVVVGFEAHGRPCIRWYRFAMRLDKGPASQGYRIWISGGHFRGQLLLSIANFGGYGLAITEWQAD